MHHTKTRLRNSACNTCFLFHSSFIYTQVAHTTYTHIGKESSMGTERKFYKIPENMQNKLEKVSVVRSTTDPRDEHNSDTYIYTNK